uniref:Uncharacterized protein n=1 Tax=Glossina morsitans morsitans TaxID=37546 RepID=A0A1B0GBV6_GLOMM
MIKAGFAGENIPKCRFPNYVGRSKHLRVMAGALEGDLFVGPKAEEHRGLLTIRYPMEHGMIWSIYGVTFKAKNREKAAEFVLEDIETLRIQTRIH